MFLGTPNVRNNVPEHTKIPNDFSDSERILVFHHGILAFQNIYVLISLLGRMSVLHQRRRMLERCLNSVGQNALENDALVWDLGEFVEDFQVFMKIGKADPRRYHELLAEVTALKQRYQETRITDACLAYFQREWQNKQTG